MYELIDLWKRTIGLLSRSEIGQIDEWRNEVARFSFSLFFNTHILFFKKCFLFFILVGRKFGILDKNCDASFCIEYFVSLWWINMLLAILHLTMNQFWSNILVMYLSPFSPDLCQYKTYMKLNRAPFICHRFILFFNQKLNCSNARRICWRFLCIKK